MRSAVDQVDQLNSFAVDFFMGWKDQSLHNYCVINLISYVFLEYKFSLSDDKKAYGKVMVKHLTQRGHICSEGWNDKASSVLCRSIGKLEYSS